MNNNHLVLVCEYYRKEMTAVFTEHKWERINYACFPARCGRPPICWEDISDIIKCQEDTESIDIFGSCCLSTMTSVIDNHPVCHMHHMKQCFYLVAEPFTVDFYLQNGAYLTTPGWLTEWKTNIDQMGMSHNILQTFFKDTITKVVLLDTGIDKSSKQNLLAFSNYVNLSCEIVPIGLSYINEFLAKMIQPLRI